MSLHLPTRLRAALPDRLPLWIAVPMVVESEGRRLSFLSTTTVFGTPVEVTLSEIAIEAFFPANEETAAALRP